MNKDWKQKSLTPVTLKENDPSLCTVEDLQNAIKENDVLNIAVTGPYGSGKSSVLKTFKDTADSSIKILDISLATLDAETSNVCDNPDSDREHNESNNNSTLSYEQKELLNRKIEYSILQQLVYRKSLEALPYSRLKKIRHFNSHSINIMAAYILGFVICIALILKLSIFQIPFMYEALRMPTIIQDAISFICVVFLAIMTYEISKYAIRNFGGLRLQRINVGGNEVDMHDDGSIFNRHLDEILYFFQCTDYNIVIIEDLDRFDTTDIFLKLRELNHLINKSEMVGRTIRFIYAVRDDMFKDSSRTKFFDYITTVIPIITTNNSKDKLKEALKNLGHEGEVSDEDIRDIAFHIDDMRLLNNIANEYHQYTIRLKSNEHPLEARKMLAMMTFKNYHPHDFSELHNRKGKLYNALSPESKRDFIKTAIDKRLSDRINLAQSNLDCHNKTCHLSAGELRLAYVMDIVNKIGQPVLSLVIDGSRYSLYEVAYNEALFDKLIRDDKISYTYHHSGSSMPQDGNDIISFSDVEKNVNHDFTYKQRLSKIGADKDQLEAEVREAELEKKRVTAYTIQELVEKFNLYEDDCFKNIGLSNLEEDFIRRGFIAEDYYDYISYFYPEIMSVADHKLSMEIKLDRKPDYDSNIENVELFINELPDPAFRYESVWNYQICDCMSEHKTLWKDKYELLIDKLTEISNESIHFLYLYSENHSHASIVFADCMKHKASNIWKKIMVAKEDEKSELYRLWFITCSLSDIHKSQLIWINKNYEFISTLYADMDDDKRDYFTHQCKYETLSPTASEMLNDVVSNGCYVPNKETAPIIVEVKKAKDDITKLSSFDEMQLSLQYNLASGSWFNAKHYFEQNGEVDDVLTKFIERNIQALKIDISCKEDEYGDFFQLLLENGEFSDTSYRQICEINNFYIDITQEIKDLPHNKVISLIETKSFNYDISNLTSLNALSPDYSCAYMVTYKDKLDEMLNTDVMSTELAIQLLEHNDFNQVEYQKIIASLTPLNVTINQSLAERICELMSLQYSTCDDSIFSDSIKLCSNKKNAVLSVSMKLRQAKPTNKDIEALLDVLPAEYQELSELGKRPKLEDNNYNKLLIETLCSEYYISSYSIDKGIIKVNTKRK